MRPELKPGDVFVVSGAGVFPFLIRLVERLTSFDGAKYSHAGIILASDGETFEALRTLRRSSIDAYIDRQIYIVRPMSDINSRLIVQSEKIAACRGIIREHEGQWYPVYRLFLHAFKPLSKLYFRGWPKVCSEIVAKYLSKLGVWRGTYAGVSPDNLADSWRDSRRVKLVFEGTWSQDC